MPWRPVTDELVRRYAARHPSKTMKHSKHRRVERIFNFSTASAEHLHEMGEMMRRNPKKFALGGFPLRGANTRLEIVEYRRK